MVDTALIEQCKKGDHHAFEKLIDCYGQKAYKTAFFIVRKKEVAEELVQEAFLKCYRDLPKLKKPEAFNTWFYKILIHMSWRISSKERINISIDESDNAHREICEENYRQENDLISAIETSERNNEIYKAINDLNPILKTTIILYYFNELSIKDISIIQGCFQGTVKSRLYTARKKLKLALGFLEDELYAENIIEKGAAGYEG